MRERWLILLTVSYGWPWQKIPRLHRQANANAGLRFSKDKLATRDRGRLDTYIVPEPFNQAFALDRCGRVDACALGDLLDDAMTARSVNGLPGRTEWNTGARAGEVQLSIVGKGSKDWEVLIPTGDRRPAHLPVAAIRRDGSPHSIRVYQHVGERFLGALATAGKLRATNARAGCA